MVRTFLWQQDGWLSMPALPESLLTLGREIEEGDDALSRKIGFGLFSRQMADILAQELRASWRIEGEALSSRRLRSSIVRRLHLDVPEWRASAVSKSAKEEKAVAAAIAMMEAAGPVGESLLCSVHALLDDGAGRWGVFRDGPESIYDNEGTAVYTAPPPEAVPALMRRFCELVNAASGLPGVVRGALAHAWFAVIHPFEDGNGRMARMLLERSLVGSTESRFRPYGVSATLLEHRAEYYGFLDRLSDRNGLLEWTRFCLEATRSAQQKADIRADGILNFHRALATAEFSRDEEEILHVMVMNPGRSWTFFDATRDMEDAEAAEEAWNSLVARGIVRQGGLDWSSLSAGPHGTGPR